MVNLTSKCNICGVEVEDSQAESHSQTHIFDARDVTKATLYQNLISQPLYFNGESLDGEKNQADNEKTLTDLRKILDELPVDLAFFLTHNLKMEYALKVAENGSPSLKIALPSRREQ